MSKKYEESGVSLQAGYEGVRRIGPLAASTRRKGCMGGIGAFGGLFDLGELNYKNPVLVSGTDGVGTKLKLAFEMNIHDTIGIDAVAMCVNDILAQGAEPLFFLDYIALGKNRPELVEQIVAGVAEGCRQAGAALIGGETAEMPGMYDAEEYDIAGFSVGAVEKDKIIDGTSIKAGDVLIGLPSTGVHSNGFSLVRKIVRDNALDLKKVYPELNADKSLGEVLLTPTKIYVKGVLPLFNEINVKGIAHITGGGFYENVPRMLPDGLSAEIDVKDVPALPVFGFLQKYGEIPAREMYNVFNMGVGLVIAVEESDADKALEILRKHGEQPFVLGKVIPGVKDNPVILRGI